MKTLPKNCKMKKPIASDVIIKDGLASNRHWMVDIQWALGLKAPRSLGMTSFKRVLQNRLVEETVKALEGRDPSHINLRSYWTQSLEQKFTPAKTVEYLFGYLKGTENYSECAMTFGLKKGPFIDIEYSALLMADPDTIIFCKEDMVILKKADGQVVAMLAGLNPKTIKKYLSRKGV